MKQLTKILLLLIINCSLLINKGLTQNLVPNPSFEQHDTCPDQGSQIYRATSWINANTGTADYYNSCFTTGINNMDVPNNLFGYQNAKSGVAYAGLYTYLYSPTPFHYREYIQAQLTTPLSNGVKYYVSFNISLSDSSYYVSDDIGIYLSSNQNNQGDYLNLSVIPQIENAEGSFLNDKTNWIRIYGEYIASGGEEYITIGNFYDDFNTDTVRVKAGNNNTYLGAYYYIDDVCLSTDSMTCYDITNIDVEYEDYDLSILIYPNPASDFFNIQNNFQMPFNMNVYNTLGQQLYSEHNITSNNLQLNISNYSSGLLFITITSNNNQFTYKLIKQ